MYETIGYIVEGFHDERAVLQVEPNAVIAVTNGSRYNRRVRMDIQRVIDQCDIVFILTDPDETGDALAAYIKRAFNLPRIHIDPQQAVGYINGKTKVGVEYCEPAYLQQVLKQAIIKQIQTN